VVLAPDSAQAASGRSPAGFSLFVVDADSPGITIHRTEPVGWRAADPATVSFDGVRVPPGQAVGRPNSGFYQHLVRRSAFGARLADLQAIRHRVADLATELAAARQLVYHAVWRYQSDDMGSVRECSMAKLYATELASRLADVSLQLHGAHGYLDGTEVARTFRDARAATIAAGPSEVMRDIIARLEIDEDP
jgi:citronellyl-CoA dehydrogenase